MIDKIDKEAFFKSNIRDFIQKGYEVVLHKDRPISYGRDMTDREYEVCLDEFENSKAHKRTLIASILI